MFLLNCFTKEIYVEMLQMINWWTRDSPKDLMKKKEENISLSQQEKHKTGK